jgi:hypothetical protein
VAIFFESGQNKAKNGGISPFHGRILGCSKPISDELLKGLLGLIFVSSQLTKYFGKIFVG